MRTRIVTAKRPQCEVCGEEATHVVNDVNLCPDHAADTPEASSVNPYQELIVHLIDDHGVHPASVWADAEAQHKHLHAAGSTHRKG